MRRTGKSLSFSGALGRNPDAAMDYNLILMSAPNQDVYYCPNAVDPAGQTLPLATDGGQPCLAGRNYTITSMYAVASVPADDNTSTMTVTVNGTDSAASVNIPMGETTGNSMGLSVPISSGAEIVIHSDPNFSGANGGMTVTIHLEPR